MPRLVLPLAIATLLMAAIAPAQAQTQDLPNPLGLRGFNLGMKLAEVRKLDHPDKPAGKVELICSRDGLSKAEESDLLADKALREAGVQGCSFFAVAAGRKRKAPLNVGGHDAEVSLVFTPKSADTAVSERLYLIVVRADPAHFDDLLAAYTARFGKPFGRTGLHHIWKNSRAALFVTGKQSES